jgi:hypothetical protein
MESIIVQSLDHGHAEPGKQKQDIRYSRCIAALFSGIVLFQAFASLSVHLSNLSLVRTMNEIIKEGYLAVPNSKILPGLETMNAAFAGGLFFTLTAGVLVCLAALGSALITLALPHGYKKYFRAFLGLVLLALAARMNLKGFLPIETMSMVLSPLLVYIVCVFSHRGGPLSIPRSAGFHAAPLLILAIVLTNMPRAKDSDLFSDFRDAFLMTNPLGMVINDFYYNHTLSPAEVFKSADQKQIRTCRLIVGLNDELQKPALSSLLLSKDYLPVDSVENPDLVLRLTEGQLSFFKGERSIMTVRLIDFFADPSDLLKNYSIRTDRYMFYRTLTGKALVTGFPLFMYLLMHAFFYRLCSLAVKKARPATAASTICFCIGILGFVFLFARSSGSVTPSNLRDVLRSPDLSRRVAGLKYISEYSLDPVLYPSVYSSMESASPLERYWFARVAARSTDPMVFNRLILLLNDPQPNVACQAYYALGMIGNVEAVPEIKRQMSESENWYVQWYAYRALKRLGWKQQRSDVKP